MLNERFWSKVSRGGPLECWLWRASTNGVGYGLFRPGGSAPRKLAHRLAYEDANGPIPPGLHCLHRCDTPGCVNPEHLFLGTNADNIADRIRKGRSFKELPSIRGDNNWTRRLPERVLRGERVGTATLTDEKARAILVARTLGEPALTISRRLGIPLTTVKQVISGRSWRHIQREYAEELARIIAPPKRVLSADDARAIRSRLASGETGRTIAHAYGVSAQTISEIRLNKIWRDA